MLVSLQSNFGSLDTVTKVPVIKLHGKYPVGATLIRTDRQTDRQSDRWTDMTNPIGVFATTGTNQKAFLSF
jgi:hypothetical protein